jgi:polyisoprenoid-binding protein YceI
MRTFTRRAAFALLGLLPAAIAWTEIREPMTLEPQSKLWIKGNSTMRAFECKATVVDAAVDAEGPDAAAAVLGGKKAVRTVQVKVPASKLDCGNGTMNDHMLKALKAKEHQTIEFRLTSYDMSPAGDTMQGQLTGTLNIGGVQKTVTISAKATEGTNGTLHVVGSHDVSMKEFGLKPPSLMMGTMKVDERVKVSFDLFLKG